MKDSTIKAEIVSELQGGIDNVETQNAELTKLVVQQQIQIEQLAKQARAADIILSGVLDTKDKSSDKKTWHLSANMPMKISSRPTSPVSIELDLLYLVKIV